MTWFEIRAKAHAEFPKLKIYRFSDSKLISFLRKFGWNMAGITLYNSIYLKDEYYETSRGAEILRHELAHIRDVHKWHILYVLSYFLILPTVFSMRAFWEWNGYKETLKSVYEEYKDADPKYREYILDYYCQWVTLQFTGASYFYMFPFSGIMYSRCQKLIKSLQN
jgi:hypothetical protein